MNPTLRERVRVLALRTELAVRVAGAADIEKQARWPSGTPNQKGGQFAPYKAGGGSGGGSGPEQHQSPPPGTAVHPRTDDHGKPVVIQNPSKPSGPETWRDASVVATFTPGSAVPKRLYGVELAPWAPPRDRDGWNQVPGRRPEIEDGLGPPPRIEGKSTGAGVIIEEPDGRVWLNRPTNGFGGYSHSFPKGTQEPGLSLQATAIKEAWEETGLKVEITGVLGDFERTTSVARIYTARRVGGTPADMGWETQAMRLAPRQKLRQLLNMKPDRNVLDAWNDETDLGKSLKADQPGGQLVISAELVQALLRVTKAAKPPPKGAGAWEKQPRWPGGTPLGGQWMTYDSAGILNPPKLGSATNPEHATKGQALYQMAKAGDYAGIEAKLDAMGPKLATAAKKPKPNYHDKQTAMLHQYGQQLVANASTKAQATATADKLAGPLPLTHYKKTGDKPGGSNPGGLYTDPDGAEVLVKGNLKKVTGEVSATVSDDRARNEVLASKLLQAAGVGAPDMKLVDLGGQYGGGLGVASTMIKDAEAFKPTDPVHLAAAQLDFATHAWLGNYDAVGMSYDNLVMKDGKAVNIDPGGSLLFRAQGLPKTLAPDAPEVESMRGPVPGLPANHQAWSVYGSMTASALKQSAERLAKLDDATIKTLTEAYGPGDPKARAALGDLLIQRRDAVLQKLGAGTATGTATGAATAAAAPAAAKTPKKPQGAKPTPQPVIEPAQTPAFVVPPKPENVATPANPNKKLQAQIAAMEAVAQSYATGKVDADAAIAVVGSYQFGVNSQNKKGLAYQQQIIAAIQAHKAAAAEPSALTPSQIQPAPAAKPAAAPKPVRPASGPALVGEIVGSSDTPAVLKPVFNSGLNSDKFYQKQVQQAEALHAAGDLAGLEALAAPKASGKPAWPATTNGIKMATYHDALVHDLKAQQVGQQAAATMMAHAEMAKPAKPQPAPGPQLPSTAAAQITPEQSPSNYKTHNAKITAIGTAAEAGDVQAILAMQFGTNSYGKKQVQFANDTLAALGSPHQVQPGQKKDTHAALNGGVSPGVAAAALKTVDVEAKPADLAPSAKAQKAVPKLSPDQMPGKMDFLHHNGTGLSTKAWVNQQNHEIQEKMATLAASGDYAALRALTYAVLDGAGKPTGAFAAVEKHPSKHITEFYYSALGAMDQVLNPPEPPKPLRLFGGNAASSAAALAAATPTQKLGQNLKKIPAAKKVLYYVALGQAPDPASVMPAKVIEKMKPATVAAGKAHYDTVSSPVKQLIAHVQSSSAVNHAIGKGEKTYGGLDLRQAVKESYKHAWTPPTGTTAYKWENLSKSQVAELAAAKPGTVLQSLQPACTSHHPTSTSHFAGGTGNRYVIRMAEGAKVLPSYGSGAFKSENELTLLAGQKFVLVGVKKNQHGGSDIELIALPPDQTYLG